MIYKTRGIVFRFTRFRETSIVVTLFTEMFGVQAYIVNGVRSSQPSAGKMALYQPLTLLDLVVYHREHANLHRVKEIKCLYPYRTLGTDIVKSTLGIFISEVLNKTVKEEIHSEDVFEFILSSLLALDHLDSGYENFHLIFLLKLSRFLGFGAYSSREVLGHRVLDERETLVLDKLVEAEYDTTVAMTIDQRRILLETLIRFYAEHIDNLGEMKSVQVLREVLL